MARPGLCGGGSVPSLMGMGGGDEVAGPAADVSAHGFETNGVRDVEHGVGGGGFDARYVRTLFQPAQEVAGFDQGQLRGSKGAPVKCSFCSPAFAS